MKENIILLHGALGSKQQFKELKGLLESKFNVLDLDFDGHGGLPVDHEFSMEYFSENVVTLMKNEGLESTHVFGYSMGGYVALTLAKRHPELVQKIVTLGTKFNWTKEAAEQETKMLNADKILEKVPKFAEQLKAIHLDHWRSVLEQTAQMMINLGDGKRLKDEDFLGINHEVLIGIGDSDRMVTIEESNRIKQLLAQSQLIILEGFRHPIEKVDQQKLASVISAFIG